MTAKAIHNFDGGGVVSLYQGDLTNIEIDAIVNAANEGLAHGGGLAGAIVRRGGSIIQEESNAWVHRHGLASHGRPALTGPGALPCKAIIHAVGPVWRGGGEGEDERLRQAYASALALAEEQGFLRLGMPSISTGIFGFPAKRGAAIALAAVESFFTEKPMSTLREVRFTLIDAATLSVFERAFGQRWP